MRARIAVLLLAACGGSNVGAVCDPAQSPLCQRDDAGTPLVCGPGTVQFGDECIASGNGIVCGPGTVQQGSQCVSTGGGVYCGPGTVQQGLQCVPAGDGGTFAVCGPGTVQQGSQCVPASDGGTSTTCGPGTVLDGGECVAAGDGGVQVTCGPGTVENGGVCWPASGDAGVPDGGSDGGLSEATSLAVDPAHTNAQPGESIASPLTVAWSASFSGAVSFPIVAQGAVFVSAAESQPNVRALDVATGALLWGPHLTGSATTLAYDGGKLFALDANGHLSALDASTGATLWTVALQEQSFYWSPPVAAGGLVYVNGLGEGGTTSAVDESSGAIVWNAFTFDGSDGTVAVADGVVYEAEACDQLSAFDAASGALRWFHSSNCTGGGGAAPGVYSGLIWERDWASGNVIIDASGKGVGSFAASVMPSFHDGIAFYQAGGTLSAVDVGTSTLAWSFSDDPQLCTSAAIAGAGGQVFVAGGGVLWELDEATGNPISRAAVAASCGSEKQSMAIAAHHLFVPAGNQLIVY